MTTTEVLDRAADILERDGGWTTEAYARSTSGRMVNVTDGQACQFCVVGAIMRAVHELDPTTPNDINLRWSSSVLAAVKALAAQCSNDGSAAVSAEDRYEAVITELNDRIAREPGEVVEKLRSAAAA